MKNKIQQILNQYWGHTSFRPLQEDIIFSILEGHDTLALLPTGGGKSICFQVPALANDGICIVISPLIALMKDQVSNLRNKGIPAVSIVSGMSRDEIDIALDNCIYGKEKFLYVSPERLTSELFLERLKLMKVNLLAIDEAHCISQWGYDFRPSYLQIASIREHLPNVPVLALTATATKNVELDIQEKLAFKNQNVFKKSFERKNLAYIVLYEEDKFGRLLKITKSLNGIGVVYVRTRKKTKEIADFLKRNKVSAEAYNAGMTSAERTKVQDNWMKEKTRVVVATNAFGMGIDKGNVRFVVHVDSPESLEAYYQEAGRAGRDEQKAFGILLFNKNDREELEQRVDLTFPDIQKIKAVYQALGNYYQLPVESGKGVSFNFDLYNFCNNYNFNMSETYNCLKVLELQGMIAMNDSVALQSRLHFTIRANDLYEFQVKNPRFDVFIKVILRLYEGVFDEFVSINESEIALRATISLEDTKSFLQSLHKLQILNYIPFTDKPQLTFTEARLDQKHLLIDKENLVERKNRFIERARSFLHYAETQNRCRSQMLVAYFGEINTERCGVCDYCLERNKAGVSDLEFGEISIRIKNLLKENEIGLSDLIVRLRPATEENTLKVVEWLVDNEQIFYKEGEILGVKP
ncbi:MAG: RecQ family ATP-dependent DNA helicase [Bacteroidetes bacterium]|nr:RecQ family ATP-dependent DNA helicase [Bacteroidota bacterium]MBP6426001.1 RecQ family ATP-dependent DNA helicase [Bacteroidia bacterium]MBP6657300.1 RecQ family ATP-dependent DNA helicase [Bacteroidia bacterium]